MLVNGNSEVIDLQEFMIVTHDKPFILVKKATIFWNNELKYNSVKNAISPGYWTFSMLKKEIKSYGTASLKANE